MIYDQKPEDMNAGSEGLKLKNYQELLAEWVKIMPKNKLNIGFEPGAQYNSGVWEGAETDKEVIDYLKKEGYGGIMFWAINQPGAGENALKLADYAQNN